MAYRLDKAVIRGEISNTVRDQITGKIWLVGLKSPLVLDLDGNCLRDLAGCSLKFSNPHPRLESDVEGLCPLQQGKCGDMSASQKVRVPLICEDDLLDYVQNKKPVPFRLANSLHLEWFSETNGRVVVEGTDFIMEVSEAQWHMTEEEERQQMASSQETFFSYLNDLAGQDLQNGDDDEYDDDDDDDDDDGDLQTYGSVDDEDEAEEGDEEAEAEEQDKRKQAQNRLLFPFEESIPEISNTPGQLLGSVTAEDMDKTLMATNKAQEDLSWTEFLELLGLAQTDAKENSRSTSASASTTAEAPDMPAPPKPSEYFLAGPLRAGADADDFVDLNEDEYVAEVTEEIFRSHFEELAELEELEDEPLNEFEWEQEFRAADRKAAAYQEAFDRYRHHRDREKLIAAAMGWEFEETDKLPSDWEEMSEVLSDLKLSTNSNDPLKQLMQQQEEQQTRHPLSRRAMRFAIKLQQDAESMGLVTNRDRRDNPLISVIVSVVSVGGKLAAGLDGMAMGYAPEPGFVVAMLKRAQVPLNEALHALSCIDQSSLPRDAQMWIATVRSALFDLRKDVLDEMNSMRKGS